MKDPQEILTKNPGSVIFARYAEELAREGRNDEALHILEKGINSNPNYAPGHSVLAEILLAMGSYEKAALELKAALHLDPQMPKDHVKLGTYYLEQSKPDKAIKYLWAALRFEPHVRNIQNAFEKVQLLETTPVDLKLSEETEKVLSKLTEDTEDTESLDIPELELDEEKSGKESGGVVGETPDIDKGDVSLSYEEEASAESFLTESIDKSEEGAQTIEGDITEELPEYSTMVESEQSSKLDTPEDDAQSTDEKNILEINEEEEYDISKYEIESSASIDEEPLLSEEERTELLTYDKSAEEINSKAIEDIQSFEVETGDEEDKGLDSVESKEFISELSSEEIEELSVTGFEVGEGEKDLKKETKEEIDYSDIFLNNGFAQEVEDFSIGDLNKTEEIVKDEDKVTVIDSVDVGNVLRPESDVENLTTNEVDEKKESTGVTDTVLSEEVPESKMKTLKIPFDSLKVVEELIKNAPHGEFSTEEKENGEVNTTSLQELITEYENIFEEESKESSIQRDERIDSTDEDYQEISEVGEDATATLAEIYLSQGMVSRAIDIYRLLLKKEPDNEELKSRLEEVKKIREQQSDIS